MSFRPCLLVPVYRHGREAEQLAARLAPLGLEGFFVDDGNDAATRARLAGLAARHDWLQLVGRPVNGGKGAAVIDGLLAAERAGFSHALQIDSDGQHDIDDIPSFLSLARAHPDALIAGAPRFDASAPRSRYYARQISRFWVAVETLSGAIQDPMCGFRVYPLAATLQAARATRGRRMDFDIEILVRLHWAGTAIRSLPTRVTYPAGGTSNFRLLEDNLLITWAHIRLVFGMLRRLPRLLGRDLGSAPT